MSQDLIKVGGNEVATPSPPPPAAPPPPTLEVACERAAAAIGRLDGALSSHPLMAAWSLRSRIDGAIQAAAWNGWKVEKSRFCAILAGVHLPSLRDQGAEARALCMVSLLGSMQGVNDLPNLSAGRLKATGLREFMPAEKLEAPGGTYTNFARQWLDGEMIVSAGKKYRNEGGMSPLQAIARVATDIRGEKEALPGALHYGIPALLCAFGLTNHPLPGVAAFPKPRANPKDWAMDFINGLRTAAERGQARLAEIGYAWDSALRALGGRRSNSRAPEAVFLALSLPVLSPAALALRLDSTIRGATLILDGLVEMGLLEELPMGRRYETAEPATSRRRGAGRAYCLTELGVGAEIGQHGSPARPNSGLAVKTLAAASAAQDLDAILDGLNLAIDRSSALLAKHGIVKAGG